MMLLRCSRIWCRRVNAQSRTSAIGVVCLAMNWNVEGRVSANKGGLTKAESSKMLNVSTSTFDRIVLAGGLPKGKKIQGKKNLLWKREDIEQYKRIMLLNARK